MYLYKDNIGKVNYDNFLFVKKGCGFNENPFTIIVVVRPIFGYWNKVICYFLGLKNETEQNNP